ncbi:MAG: Gliding motility-associated C-terminal protein, partial [Chitinophagaceae bacterium]|nr:Gliding motility-associated C-terminal protein [Chitinophagaceae bacterium]
MKTLYFLFFFLISIPLSFAQGFLGLDRIICTGGNTTLDAGPGYNEYHWSSGETTQTIVASAGTYSADRRIVSSSQTVDISQPDGSNSISYSADISQSFTMNSTGYLKAVELIQSGYNQVATSPNFIITKGDGPSGTIISTNTASIPATGAGPQNIDLSISIPGNVLVYKDSVYTFTFSNGG